EGCECNGFAIGVFGGRLLSHFDGRLLGGWADLCGGLAVFIGGTREDYLAGGGSRLGGGLRGVALREGHSTCLRRAGKRHQGDGNNDRCRRAGTETSHEPKPFCFFLDAPPAMEAPA